MKQNYFIKNGQLNNAGIIFFLVLGVAIIFLTVQYAESRLFRYIGFFGGLFVMGVASTSIHSAVFGLKPFTKDPMGWRKARKTYKDKAEQTTTTDAHSSKPANEDEPPLKN